MMRFVFYLITVGLVGALFSCEENKTKDEKTKVCEESSIWRDHNGPDNCSYYNDAQSCDEILGKLNVISRLHKGTLGEGVFEGGMSSRWYDISRSKIEYYTPDGEIADQGNCRCHDGVLTIDWKNRFKRTMEYKIYFNSSEQVELRYFDYPFDFNKFQYDSTSMPENPTKILGTIK